MPISIAASCSSARSRAHEGAMVKTALEDDPIDRPYDWMLLRRLLRYLGPYKLAVAAAIALIVVMAALDLVGPYLTKLAIDRHIRQGDAEGLRTVALLYVVALLAAFVVRFGQVYI